MFTGSVCTSTIADVVFLVDSSGSICDDLDVRNCSNWQAMKNFINQIVDQLTIGASATRVGLVVYGTIESTRVEFFLDSSYDKATIMNNISNLQYVPFQTTNTGTGINLVMSDVFNTNRGDRDGVQNIMILLTDGKTTTPGVDVIAAADSAKAGNNGARILVIGVTASVDVNEIRLISSNQVENQTYWIASEFANLGTMVASQVISVTCVNSK